jgi:Dolichyl-phosphate-mannose-protein mannosyltransferase
VIEALYALVTFLLHAATAWRYGYFRDELYFIACSKHLAWGYVDQPPLVAFAAWLSSPVHYELVALRLLPILAAAATVFLTVALTGELGGGRFARTLSGAATMLTPAYLLLGNTLTTTSVEPLSWTLVIYTCVRRSWLGLGLALAFAAYGKYSVLLLVAGVAAGFLLTRERRGITWRWAIASAGLALLLLVPNLWWQASHGWPIVDVLRGDAAHRPAFANGLALESRNLATNAQAFALEQLLYTNPVAAPLWLAGLVAPFTLQPLRDLRFLTIAYAVAFLAAAALAAKGYYIIGIYASLFAVGAIAIERWALWLRVALVSAVVAVGIAAMPLSLPILPVQTLVAYMKALRLTGADDTPARLVQPVFAEEFGWGRLARDVAAVYYSLPRDVRPRTAVYADTYGDAGALDFFGPRFGLPPAISSQNTYYLWGTRGQSGDVLVAVGASRIAILRKYYRNVVLVATSNEPYKWIVEGPSPIYVCRDPVAPLSWIWPHLRWYGA